MRDDLIIVASLSLLEGLLGVYPRLSQHLLKSPAAAMALKLSVPSVVTLREERRAAGLGERKGGRQTDGSHAHSLQAGVSFWGGGRGGRS